MKDGMYINGDKQRAEYYFHVAESQNDFLEWLFDTELWYMTQTEAWDNFEKFQDEQHKKEDEKILPG